MKKLIKLSTPVIAGLFLLSGCGGGGSVDSDVESGNFVDSFVQGLQYVTDSGKSGVTDEYGRFEYKRGERVRFRLGKLYLGEAVPETDGLVTPDSFGVSEDVKVNILRFLQSLDADNNTSNGITISQEVLDALSTLSEDVDISSLQSDQDILSLDDNLVNYKNILDEYLDRDYDGLMDINESTALAHFERSLYEWRNGYKNSYTYTNYTDFYRNSIDLSVYPLANLTDEYKYALAHMWNEEKLAKDIYLSLYEVYPLRQLENIALRSEETHEGLVENLIQRYDINITNLEDYKENYSEEELRNLERGEFAIEAIGELYDTLYSIGTVSDVDALKVGCMVEVTDINDLDNYIAMAQDANLTDFVVTFEVLRDGSYSHYWAFDKGLKNLGVLNGCCSLGEINGVNYCHEEYPQR